MKKNLQPLLQFIKKNMEIIPLTLAGVVSLSVYVLSRFSPSPFKENGYLIIIFIMIVIGSIGIIDIIKREIPGPFGKSITGFPAILSGTLVVIICWGFALVLFFIHN